MNHGSVSKLAKEIMPTYGSGEKIRHKSPDVSIRDRKIWNETLKACQQPETSKLFTEDSFGRGKKANEARGAANSFCRECPVSDQCFEYALLTGSEGVMYAGVPASTLVRINRAIGIKTREYLSGVHPENPDRQDFYDASRLLLQAIHGEITPDVAVQLRAEQQAA